MDCDLPEPLPSIMGLVSPGEASTPREALAVLHAAADRWSHTRTGPRCTGGCCQVFWLPFKPGFLPELAAGASLGSTTRLKGVIDPEAPMIADMVIPLADTLDGLAPELRKLVAFYDDPMIDQERVNAEGAFYTCRHYDAASQNCTIYDQRPRMCRTFPNDGVCKYTGCTTDCTPEKRSERIARDTAEKLQEVADMLKAEQEKCDA